MKLGSGYCTASSMYYCVIPGLGIQVLRVFVSWLVFGFVYFVLVLLLVFELRPLFTNRSKMYTNI